MKISYNPGGFNAKRHFDRHDTGRSVNRHRYTNAEKLGILGVFDKLVMEERMTQSQAADVLKVNQSCISRWAKKKDELLANPKKSNKMSDHKGHLSMLADIEKDLLNFIEEWRQKGFDVNRFTLLRKAGQLKHEVIEGRSNVAVKICLSRFLAKHGLTHRVATHKAQCDPREVEGEALNFLEYIRPRLSDGSRHPDFILNMDQTGVYHAVETNKTIDRVGARTINLRTSANDSKRVTVAATITASGRRVKPMVVFKGK